MKHASLLKNICCQQVGIPATNNQSRSFQQNQIFKTNTIYLFKNGKFLTKFKENKDYNLFYDLKNSINAYKQYVFHSV